LADIKSKEERSVNMAKIRSKKTKPEMYIRSALSKRNHRFRVNYKLVEGHPDIYFTRIKVAVFIHGCYWHRHYGCKYAYTPKSNINFWVTKFEINKNRDDAVYEELKNNGVRILIIWECTVNKMKTNIELHNEIISRIEIFLNDNDQLFLEI
jgi:DNA mismatch endonuclease (patch repair protein)